MTKKNLMIAGGIGVAALVGYLVLSQTASNVSNNVSDATDTIASDVGGALSTVIVVGGVVALAAIF